MTSFINIQEGTSLPYINIITKSESSNLYEQLRERSNLTIRDRINQLMNAADKPCTLDAYLELVNRALQQVSWLPESEKRVAAYSIFDRLGIKNFQLNREKVDYLSVLTDLVCQRDRNYGSTLYLERVHWNSLAWRIGSYGWTKEAKESVGYRNRKSLVNRHILAKSVVL